MKNLRIIFYAVLMSCICLVGSAFAHGTGYKQSDKPAIVLEYSYSTGESMSYQAFVIKSPARPDAKWLSGRTDENGRLAFIPNVPGTWIVEVSDDEGHRAEAKVDVTEDFLKGTASAPATVKPQEAVLHGVELWIRCILGVSVLFNIAAFVTLNRKKSSNASGVKGENKQCI